MAECFFISFKLRAAPAADSGAHFEYNFGCAYHRWEHLYGICTHGSVVVLLQLKSVLS